MRRSIPARLFSALLAICFTAIVTEPVTLHACPVHDGVLVASAATHHGMHHADAAPPPAGEHGSRSHGCACMGDCAGGVPAALAPVRLTIADIAPIDDLRATAVPFAAHAVGPVPHALPFANGPPAPLLA